MTEAAFRRRILGWYRTHGRHWLSWRHTRDPYRILVSEIMLQQTQVSRVVPKYAEFIAEFPTVRALARAKLPRVLARWSGLGYNRRAIHLKRAAEIIWRRHRGVVPATIGELRALPGIGPGSAGAIIAFARGERVAFIETNIRKVYIHFFFSGRRGLGDGELLRKIWRTLPGSGIREWYYALMDYGALNMGELENPNRRSRHYAKQPRFSGSDREMRGKILKMLVSKRALSERSLIKVIGIARNREAQFRSAVQSLGCDGFLARGKAGLHIKRSVSA